jgi:hypothetical protein
MLILPIFSKVFEKIVSIRLINYMDSLHILVDNQFGFRSGHSTSLALLQLYNKISSAIDLNEFTIGIFLYLSKAFNTVNHSILFDKLQHYGIRVVTLDWFKSYLVIDSNFFSLMGCMYSKKTPIYCGVPQGSILAPLLFLLYINDINKVSNVANLILFADDTNLFYSHNNLPFLIDQVNGELDKLSVWLSANKLSINLKKTNFMIFRPRQKKFHINPKIVLNSFEIDMVD